MCIVVGCLNSRDWSPTKEYVRCQGGQPWAPGASFRQRSKKREAAATEQCQLIWRSNISTRALIKPTCRVKESYDGPYYHVVGLRRLARWTKSQEAQSVTSHGLCEWPCMTLRRKSGCFVSTPAPPTATSRLLSMSGTRTLRPHTMPSPTSVAHPRRKISSRPTDKRFWCATTLQQTDLHFPGSYVWVDAICINPDDLAEKSAQVAMMGEIYNKA